MQRERRRRIRAMIERSIAIGGNDDRNSSSITRDGIVLITRLKLVLDKCGGVMELVSWPLSRH